MYIFGDAVVLARGRSRVRCPLITSPMQNPMAEHRGDKAVVQARVGRILPILLSFPLGEQLAPVALVGLSHSSAPPNLECHQLWRRGDVAPARVLPSHPCGTKVLV